MFTGSLQEPDGNLYNCLNKVSGTRKVSLTKDQKNVVNNVKDEG